MLPEMPPVTRYRSVSQNCRKWSRDKSAQKWTQCSIIPGVRGWYCQQTHNYVFVDSCIVNIVCVTNSKLQHLSCITVQYQHTISRPHIGNTPATTNDNFPAKNPLRDTETWKDRELRGEKETGRLACVVELNVRRRDKPAVTVCIPNVSPAVTLVSLHHGQLFPLHHRQSTVRVCCNIDRTVLCTVLKYHRNTSLPSHNGMV